jgi:hypothetical protein
MITAKEFIKQNAPCSIEGFMIEFAKLHVKACKKEISEDYLYYLEGDEGSERLNSDKFKKEVYSLDNIK